jgi:hypothetical protein
MLLAEGGLPCSWRLGRSRVRHRRDPGRAARATLPALFVLPARGQARPEPAVPRIGAPLAWTACSRPRSPARRLPWWSCVSEPGQRP